MVRTELAAPALNLDSQVDLLRALRRVGHPGRPPRAAGSSPSTSTPRSSRSRLQEARAPAQRERLDLDRRVDHRRPLPPRLRAGRHRDRALGDSRRRRAAAARRTCAARSTPTPAGRSSSRMPRSSSRACSPAWRDDEAMAAAGRGRDFYGGIVDAGVVETRDQAKVAMLGAMYGATTGESGRLVPRLARAYPRAMALVDARGARGRARRRSSRRCSADRRRCRGRVARGAVAGEPAGRDAPPTSGGRARGRATGAGSRATSSCRAPRRSGRSAGWRASARGCAAIGEDARRRSLAPRIRARLRRGCRTSSTSCTTRSSCTRPPSTPTRSPTPFARPRDAAGRLLFGDFPVDFPLDLAIVESYASADG